MEFQKNMRRAATRPMAWVAGVLVALALGLIGWNMRPIVSPPQSTLVDKPVVAILESPRVGGPGGQIGDAPLPEQSTRVGGPGGQIGDVP
jgi:hypothetical protein